MSDRELLELAAKAAGVGIRPMEIDNVEYLGDNRFIGFLTNPDHWPTGWFSPHKDCGDALRLAATLKIDVTFDNDAWMVNDVIHAYNVSIEDGLRSTCRAIVRAAAEIGRNMP